MTEMLNLAVHVAQKLGACPDGPVECPGCKSPLAPFLITRGLGMKWRCGHCWMTQARDAAPAWQLGWDDIRGARNAILRETDWTQAEPPADMPESAVTAWNARRATYATYRAALRDMIDETKSPAAAVWPTPPN